MNFPENSFAAYKEVFKTRVYTNKQVFTTD